MSSTNPTVFMIGWEYPPNNSGGLGVACEGLTKALAQQNTQIYFTLPYHHAAGLSHVDLLACVDPRWGTQPDQPPFSSYQASIRSTKQLSVGDLTQLPTSELEHRVAQYAQLVKKAEAEVNDSVDIIHAHDWMTFPAATAIAKKTGKPLITHIHSTEFDRIPGGQGSAYIHHQEFQGMSQADRVIVVSDYTKHVLISKYGIDPAKIDVVHNGVPAGPAIKTSHTANANLTPAFAGKRPVVVFMGRLTQQKGAEYFLALAKQVLSYQPQTLFVIAGDGDQYSDLLVSAAGQALSASVVFTGFIRGQQKNKVLDRADVFVMPSLSEPFGLVALEAAQRQTPVIISKTTGVSEVLPSAVAVDFWDIAKMTEAILELLTNPPRRQAVITAQLQDLRKTTWNQAARGVKDVYRKAFIG